MIKTEFQEEKRNISKQDEGRLEITGKIAQMNVRGNFQVPKALTIICFHFHI